jgi:hypothetical protein
MKRKPLVLDLRNKNGLRGFEITLPAFEERGYYLGEVIMGGGWQTFDGTSVSFHVEAIEVTETEIPGVGGVLIEAVNPVFQNRIDRFDEGEVPSVLKIGRKKFFITMQPFAQ